jgi:DNA-binding MarR family transcriptional regulator
MSVAIERRQLDRLSHLMRLAGTAVSLGPTAADGMSPAHVRALRYLSRCEGGSVKELSSALALSLAAGAELADRLVGKGLVSRSHNPADRRRVVLRLTPTGRRLVGTMDKTERSWMREVMSRLPGDAVEALTSLLESFLMAGFNKGDHAGRLCRRCLSPAFEGCPLLRLQPTYARCAQEREAPRAAASA